MIVVKIDGIEQAMRELDPKKVERAARLAINEAATAGRTEAARSIRDKWNLKPSQVNQEIKKVKVATQQDLSAVVQAKGREISLVKFGFRPVKRTVQTAGGKTRLTVGATGKVLKGVGVSYRRAFFATMSSGHQGVFISSKDRKGGGYGYHTPSKGVHAGERGRSKIVSLATITIASMLNQAKAMDATVKKIGDVLNRRFQHHFDRLK